MGFLRVLCVSAVKLPFDFASRPRIQYTKVCPDCQRENAARVISGRKTVFASTFHLTKFATYRIIRCTFGRASGVFL
ncbi:MAG: hypothetical protein B1H02_07355 [Candidatus Latescibacteria bacterium 4484_107]|nr:MAG: hypothetical protein B1H02_07355 [Candidatus Latescibacteria bacterium 4484_107]